MNKKLCPTDSIASLQAETDLVAIKMAKNEDPFEFHDKLHEVKQRYPNAISELQVRNAMIRQCRKEYREDVVKAMSLPDSTTEDLLDGMMNRFRCMNAHYNSDDSDDEDVALAAAFQRSPSRPNYDPNPTPDYLKNMVCYLCGEKGHKIANCPKRAKGFQVKYNYCGRHGHRAEKCYHHPDNLPTAPAWIRRMNGLEATVEVKKSTDEEGAFAFLSPPTDDNEVSFALYSHEDEMKTAPSIMTVKMKIEGQDPTDGVKKGRGGARHIF